MRSRAVVWLRCLWSCRLAESEALLHEVSVVLSLRQEVSVINRTVTEHCEDA